MLGKIRSSRLRALLGVGGLLGASGIGWAAHGMTSPPPSPVPQITAHTPAKPVTVVTLGFDDAYADQMQALPLLREKRLSATFYVISGVIGRKGVMTWKQVAQVAAAGHEIGGHTVDHHRLKGLSVARLRHEICDDRVTLFKKGYKPVSFAYPLGSYDDNAAATVLKCGYNNGRLTSGLYGKGPFSETLPPANPSLIRTRSAGTAPEDVVANIEAGIKDAQAHGGGWYNIVLHHICDTCRTDSISRADFIKLLAWLRQSVDDGSIMMRTAGQVVGGPVRPPISAAALTAQSAH
ncbi:polysaccharide deacetylase family protein [Planotetraspora kaengkrachanensis]|uniref:NodB homology domain-containing protein n=1 Tax=Planotetraspora kaengkrachanensis TaxID=575193 RepID=A0A8J3PVM9_9ACTN|nr:polysaccharide deacetylase family protein [Planotetraspora kaengkrachanensis]GIG81875.1 hypothetical protein Pka01_50020 [Planotetraspora kaengkrachanensis]